jgi:hypothetical protein
VWCDHASARTAAEEPAWWRPSTDWADGIKKGGTAGGEAIPPKLVAHFIERDIRGRKQGTAEAAPHPYVEAIRLEKVNETVLKPIFIGSTQIFFQRSRGA